MVFLGNVAAMAIVAGNGVLFELSPFINYYVTAITPKAKDRLGLDRAPDLAHLLGAKVMHNPSLPQDPPLSDVISGVHTDSLTRAVLIIYLGTFEKTPLFPPQTYILPSSPTSDRSEQTNDQAAQ